VELSESLFEIIRYIDKVKPMGRYIFLPRNAGKEIIPPIFHPIRALQLQLFYYDQPEELEARLEQFKQEWGKFVNPIRVEQAGNPKDRVHKHQTGFGFMLFASILILVLAGLIAEIIPRIPKVVLNLTPTAIRPPTASAFWLNESFQNIDTSTRWQEQHYYRGKQPMQTRFSETGLTLMADPIVTEAVYGLESMKSWPLDQLQSLSFSFAMSGLVDPAAKNELIFGLILSKDDTYQLDCLVIPAKVDARIQCQIRTPAQSLALNEAVSLSLGKAHTARLIFYPQTYSVRFFLDEQYQGQGVIPSIEYWRGKNFKILISDELQNLSSGSFSSQLESCDLAHQP
jgi:hypothetical protein